MAMKKKLLAGLLATTMIAGLLSGCGASEQRKTAVTETETGTTEEKTTAEDAQSDTSEHVVLTMYCIGDEGGIYAQDHLDAVNRILTEKINAEIKPVMVSWGDYKTKLPMVWASGEAYDLTYVANWTGYQQEAGRGAFMDITDIFEKYAPKTYAEYVEADRVESSKVNGRLYMVPNNKTEFTSNIYNYREDLRKKYNCPEIVDKETLDTYLQAIKDNESGMTPFGNNSNENFRFWDFLNKQDWSRPIDDSAGTLVYDLKDPSKVFNITQTPEYKAFIEESRDYYNKGYWSQSIMAETSLSKDNFLAGKVALSLENVFNSNSMYSETASKNPDWEIGTISMDVKFSDYGELVTPINGGVAIGAYSKNPERAMMLIELVHQDQEVYDLFCNGLEGVTFEKDDATMTKWIPEGIKAEDIPLKNLGMGWEDKKYDLSSKNDSASVTAINDELLQKETVPVLGGFALNQDNISAELAALKSVYAEYKMPLEKGVVDTEEGLTQLQTALEQAGLSKVQEDINQQITEYLKTMQ